MRQAARRLVEHEHAASARERTRDLDELLRGGREVGGDGIRGDVGVPELGERGLGGPPHPLAIDDAQRTARRLDAERDVLHDAQMRRERGFLMNHRHAGLSRRKRIRAARTAGRRGAWRRASGVSAPARTAISVLLPAPFWPTSAQTSPAHTRRSTSSSAIVAPKDLQMPRISRRGAVEACPTGSAIA